MIIIHNHIQQMQSPLHTNIPWYFAFYKKNLWFWFSKIN